MKSGFQNRLQIIITRLLYEFIYINYVTFSIAWQAMSTVESAFYVKQLLFILLLEFKTTFTRQGTMHACSMIRDLFYFLFCVLHYWVLQSHYLHITPAEFRHVSVLTLKALKFHIKVSNLSPNCELIKITGQN